MTRERSTRAPVNAWGFLQTVTVASMSKGQFPIACITAILIAIILKMPPEHSSRLLDRIFANLTQLRGISYLLNIILVSGWMYHVRLQRRMIASEMERIGREKTDLQERATGCELTTFGRRKSI